MWRARALPHQSGKETATVAAKGTAMNESNKPGSRADGQGLNQGGPGDQKSPRKQQGDENELGSQSGRVQHQAPLMPKHGGAQQPGQKRPEAKDLPQRSTAEDERGVSDTERRAGSPDPRATTDSGDGSGAG